MDEHVLCLLQTLAEVERELGEVVYDNAVERARLPVAAEVMVEAERRALMARRVPQGVGEGVVVPFPVSPRGQS